MEAYAFILNTFRVSSNVLVCIVFSCFSPHFSSPSLEVRRDDAPLTEEKAIP